MTSMTVSDKIIAIAKRLNLDCYDYTNHTMIEVKSKLEKTDSISDVITSIDGKYLAIITSISKQLIVYELPITEKCKTFALPRSASKIRFTVDSDQILVADKSGDAYIYNIKNEDTGMKLLGHLSLLLDILQTSDGKYIVTCDRDEKIRISCYPNTYNIETFCLGHKEFVNHLELLPHDVKVLTSTSGDGQVKCWNIKNGSLLYNIDTYCDVDDDQLKEQFTTLMYTEGLEVSMLPIVHYTAGQLNDNSSILAVVLHTYNKLLIYNIQTINNKFSHVLIDKLKVNRLPAAMTLYKLCLYLYDDVDDVISVFKVFNEDQNIALKFHDKIKVFENKIFNPSTNDKEDIHESIKVLYKRKFDNVQEYQERKKQRLEKSV